MTDEFRFPIQGVVYTGVETLIETNGEPVTDIDPNLVIGTGIKTADGILGVNIEAGGFYFQKDDTYLIGYTSSGCAALDAMGSDQPCDASGFDGEPIYGINSIHHESRGFAGISLALQTPKMHVAGGDSSTLSGKVGYRKVFFEDDVHIDKSILVEQEQDDKLTLELGVARYFDTPEQFGTPVLWVGAIAQVALDDDSHAQIGPKATLQFQF